MFLECLNSKKNNIIFWDNVYSLLIFISVNNIGYDLFNLIQKRISSFAN